MKAYVRTFKQKIQSLDKWILIPSVILALMSIITLYGGAEHFGISVAITQTAAFAVGLFACIFLAMLDYDEYINRLYILLFAGSVILLSVTIFFGIAVGSNQSWITIPGIGVTIQPSEFVKITFIATFARHLSKVDHKINKFSTVIPLAIHAMIVVGLVLVSGDLGVALVYMAIIAVMLFCAGLSLLYFAGVIGAVVIVFPYIWPHLAEYQQKRILVGFNPESDPLGFGMQALLSRKCIASGGLFGKGFGNGELYMDVPVSSSDFVFATFCEQFGMIGAFFYIGLVFVIVVRLIILARKSRDKLGSYVCAGVIAVLVAQMGENIGMALATLPVIGITLPFMSSGGSSMLSIVALMGLPMSVYMHRNEKLALLSRQKEKIKKK
ncbi:MAG: hypothetical protein E7601_07710 [Ruminococcaceae bacterium]|nr:hypothetical protein [Oscillospiraceae bacterium]